MSDYPVRYTRAGTTLGDVYEIVIYADRKLRRFNDGTEHGKLNMGWILYRTDVQHLTLEEWYASPGAAWSRKDKCNG